MGLIKKLFGSKPAPKPGPGDAKEPPKGKRMFTLDPNLVIEPFGKINYWDLPNGGKRVRAYFLMESPIEGAQTGVAIDGSGSMQAWFGKEAMRQVRHLTDQEWVALIKMGLARQYGNRVEINNLGDPRAVGALINFGVLQEMPPGPNIVEEQSRQMTEYLSRFDADGGTTVIYWATADGKGIEVIGDLTGPQCATAAFPGPTEFGSETHLLPAIKYFVERFADARWGMYVFITDGALNDLEQVKRYCVRLARDIVSGKQNDLKFVLIGVGDDVDEDQMEELDDLETGTDLDLWDHKIAKEMKQLAEIFAEVVSESVVVVPNDGVIKDANGEVSQDYRDSGLPALMWFDLPPNTEWFSLEVAGQKVAQPLRAGVQVPSFAPAAPAAPVAPAAPAAASTPCLECREPLALGTKICPRCGVSQDIAAPSPPPKPEPAPTAPPAPAGLSAEPARLDLGTVTNWRGDLPTADIRLFNSGSQAWNGSANATPLWLEVSPSTVSCPAGSETVLTAKLTSAGSGLRPRTYSVDDAIVIEGGGQKIEIAAQVTIKK